MFDLTLGQQIPAQAFNNEEFKKTYTKCIAIIYAPFEAEQRRLFREAITLHAQAIGILNSMKSSKGTRKFHRKMYEKQIVVHEERSKYLTGLNGNYDNVFMIPTRLLEPDLTTYSQPGPLSQVANPSGAPPVEFAVTYDSDLVDLGVRSCWHFIKDKTETHTLYALQGMWDLDRPIVETILRRPDEFFPMGGSTHIMLQRQPIDNFKLRVQRRNAEDVWELPASTCQKKEWSPRRFSYNGRHFVWRLEDGKDTGLLSKKFGFETLYETQDESEGSPVIGEKLFTGRIHGKGKARWYLNLCPGLDPFLQEHIIATQLSRMFRWVNPPNKDVAGVEKGIVALSGMSAALSLASLMG